jgi:hypothetical protein
MGLDPTLRSFGVLERQSSVRSAQGRSGQSSNVIVPSRSPGGMGLDPTLRSFGVLERLQPPQLATEVFQTSKLLLRFVF